MVDIFLHICTHQCHHFYEPFIGICLKAKTNLGGREAGKQGREEKEGRCFSLLWCLQRSVLQMTGCSRFKKGQTLTYPLGRERRKGGGNVGREGIMVVPCSHVCRDLCYIWLVDSMSCTLEDVSHLRCVSRFHGIHHLVHLFHPLCHLVSCVYIVHPAVHLILLWVTLNGI